MLIRCKNFLKTFSMHQHLAKPFSEAVLCMMARKRRVFSMLPKPDSKY